MLILRALLAFAPASIDHGCMLQCLSRNDCCRRLLARFCAPCTRLCPLKALCQSHLWSGACEYCPTTMTQAASSLLYCARSLTSPQPSQLGVHTLLPASILVMRARDGHQSNQAHLHCWVHAGLPASSTLVLIPPSSTCLIAPRGMKQRA